MRRTHVSAHKYKHIWIFAHTDFVDYSRVECVRACMCACVRVLALVERGEWEAETTNTTELNKSRIWVMLPLKRKEVTCVGEMFGGLYSFFSPNTNTWQHHVAGKKTLLSCVFAGDTLQAWRLASHSTIISFSVIKWNLKGSFEHRWWFLKYNNESFLNVQGNVTFGQSF